MTNQTPSDDNCKLQAVGDNGRLMLIRSDGSARYTARANVGDCYWRVAADVLLHRAGKAPTDTEIANFVVELAKHNKKVDANILAVGEDIEIPPPTVAPN